MELEELWRTIKSALGDNKWLILGLCVVSMATGVGISYAIPEKYSATALVLVRPQETLELSSGGSTDREVLNLPASGSTLQVETPSKTYIEVIRSRAVAERIVRSLGLDRLPAPPVSGFVGILKDRVRRAVDVARDLAMYGRIVEINPFERAVAELIANISLASVRDTFVFDITYVSGDPKQAAAVANAAAQVFVEYRSQDNERDAKGRREFVEKQLLETEQSLLDGRHDLRAYKERHKMASFEEERTEQIKAVAALEAQLEETEIELAGALQQFTPVNPVVTRLQGRKERLVETLGQTYTRLKELPKQEADLADLELRVRTLESTYEFLKKEFEQARFREASQTTEIRVVSPATVPTYPVKPIKVYYGALALLMGLLAGVGIALALELFDRRIRTGDDAVRVLDVPVLATLPRWKR
jgi:uncharacterized protein involved in exopolysaccharide biosynthesis